MDSRTKRQHKIIPVRTEDHCTSMRTLKSRDASEHENSIGIVC